MPNPLGMCRRYGRLRPSAYGPRLADLISPKRATTIIVPGMETGRPTKSFWTSLPGILTGLAAVIGATVGLLALFADNEGPSETTLAEIVAEGQGWTLTSNGRFTNQRFGYGFDVQPGWEVGEGLAGLDPDGFIGFEQVVSFVGPQPLLAFIVVGAAPADGNEAEISLILDEATQAVAGGALGGVTSNRTISLDGRDALEANINQDGNPGIIVLGPGNGYIVILVFLGSDEGVYSAHVNDFNNLKASFQFED